MVRLLVFDDHEVVRRGLKTLLDGTEIELVAALASLEDVVEDVAKHQPHVVLLDVRMGERGGLDVLHLIKQAHPDVRVVMMSAFENPTYVARCVALGGDDFVSKSERRHVLVDTILRAARGESPAPTSVFLQVRENMKRRKDQASADLVLTNREIQVLRHLALGLSNREIGLSLNISVETVKEHVQNILRKSDVTDRTQAAVWAVKRGLV